MYRNIFKENTPEKVKILGFSLELFSSYFCLSLAEYKICIKVPTEAPNMKIGRISVSALLTVVK